VLGVAQIMRQTLAGGVTSALAARFHDLWGFCPLWGRKAYVITVFHRRRAEMGLW